MSTTLRRAALLLPLLLLTACPEKPQGSFVIPGGTVTTEGGDDGGPRTVKVETAGGSITATSEDDGTTSRVEVTSAAGTTTMESDGDRATIRGPQGTTTIDTTLGLDALGVPVPPGARPKKTANSAGIAEIVTPQGKQITAALEMDADTDPKSVVAFYEERYTLSMQVVTGDAAMISAQLEDGATLTVSLGKPKKGVRDCVVMVMRPAK